MSSNKKNPISYCFFNTQMVNKVFNCLGGDLAHKIEKQKAFFSLKQLVIWMG